MVTRTPYALTPRFLQRLATAATGELLRAVSYLGLRYSSMSQLVSSARLSAALLGALVKVPACESKVQPGSPNPSEHVAQGVSVSSTCTTQTARDLGLRNRARWSVLPRVGSVETFLAFLNDLHCGIPTSTFSNFSVPHGLPL